MYKQIRQELLNLQDKKYKEFHSSLCPGTNNIIGIRTPVFRKFAKELSKQSYAKEYIFYTETKYYEEVLLQGMLIGLLKNTDIKELLTMIKNFVPKIDNWAVCDTFCSGLKIVNQNKEIFWKFIQKYTKSKKEFELRFAVVIMLNYYLTDEYILQVLQILDGIKHDGYYIKMAIAWAISFAFIKCPKQTMPYLKNNHLDTWTHNKSLQKIIESYRVSPTTKDIIRKMKR